MFKCFLCRHLWHGTLSSAKTVLKYFTWHSHTQRKFHLRVGTTICTGTHSKSLLYYKITIKYYKLNTKHLKSFFATSHAKFYQSATQAQNFYRDKKNFYEFLFTIYGTIYTTTYSGIFSAQTLYTVVYSQARHYKELKIPLHSTSLYMPNLWAG